MKVTILGSGSPEAYACRASSGYLLQVAGQNVLFDCGGGVVGRLLEAGSKPSDVDYLFFTHLHSDHMMDYARLVRAAWDDVGKPLKVLGPAPVKDVTTKLFSSDGVLAHDLAARTELKESQEVWVARGDTLPRTWPAPEVREITPGFTFEDKVWSLTSCSVPHAQPLLICIAFSVIDEGEKCVSSWQCALTARTTGSTRIDVDRSGS